MQAFNVWGNVRKAVKDNEEKIVDFNRWQMLRGIAPDGNNIRPRYKSFEYADVKAERGGPDGTGSLAPFRVPDLYLTGAFQDKMYIKVWSRDYEINSKDKKAGKLETDYNPFGLIRKHEAEARAFNTATLGMYFKRHTGL